MPSDIYEQLTRDEGIRRELYRDALGNPTVGVGHLLTTPLSDRAIRTILEDDVANATTDLHTHLPWTTQLSGPRQGVLVNMAFNMGIGGLLGFSRMLRAMEQKDWDIAAAELLHSVYAKQVGDRAQRLATQLKTDAWT